MKQNVGGPDRAVRLLGGFALIVLGAAGYLGVVTLATGPVPQALGSVLAIVVGLVLFVTGATRRCPINSLLGVNTFRRKRGEDRDPSDRPR